MKPRDSVKPEIHPTTFQSVLFAHPEDRDQGGPATAPDFFSDLNCDKIVNGITSGKEKEEYNLKPFFYHSLHTVDAIQYRQEVMRDLEHAPLFQKVISFSGEMRRMRKFLELSQKPGYKEHKQAWFLSAVESYCNAVTALFDDLSDSRIASRGLRGFRDYLEHYMQDARFTKLALETRKLQSDLATIRYSMFLKEGGRITVRKYDSESDYSVEIEKTFARFKQDVTQDHRVRLKEDDPEYMNHIEAKILQFVARLYPEEFARLDRYWNDHVDYADKTIELFDREIQFYTSYLDYVAEMKKAGLSLCYPRISGKDKTVLVKNGFDMALAEDRVRYREQVVCNTFHLNKKERIMVVTGPNQGGKTTFARMFGQIHFLASLGLPVPGTEAEVLLFDHLFTHFEREEKVENLRGKLEDDLIRIRNILRQATSRSIIILNEIFTSTTLHDEVFLSTKLMEKISRIGVLCVWVTFVVELASYGRQVVSMVSQVDPANPAVRTFRIVRRRANGLAYALAIARKYGLTYHSVKERIKP
jgi:DNA mismatch repair protein MutS